MKKIIFLTFTTIFFIIFSQAYATHNRAGEITYEQVSEFTYRITLLTYTYTPSAANESRDSLTIMWGDDTFGDIPRIQIQYLPDEIQKNIYVGYHTYPGSGVYEIVMSDPNRNDGIVNIPNSVNIVFTVKTTLKIDPFLGFNNTPILLNPPIDKAAKGRIFVHNPSAYDIDGDSLSYKLATCYGDNGLKIKDYNLPAASNEIYVNPVTGDLVWDSPIIVGEYNIAVEIEEWRNGVKIGSVVRDMQIKVSDTKSHPPKIENLPDYCVTAGDTLSFSVTATDEDLDYITLSGSGGVLQVIKNPARFPEVTAKATVTSYFTWETECSHVQLQPYSVLFRAEDDNREVQLTDYEDINITVVAPAPKNLQIEAFENKIDLKWNASECNNALGYKIYRKKGTSDFIPDQCQTGVPESTGFVMIDSITGVDNVLYTDDEKGKGLTQGYVYCYRIISYFADGAESYSSEEVCAELKRTVPVFTLASVENTDINSGKIEVEWQKPSEFDTILYPGPYKYILEAAGDLNPALYSEISELSGIDNTKYSDIEINTKELPRSYKLSLYDISRSERKIGESAYTTSVFLTADQADKTLNIKFNNNTAWTNFKYTIFIKEADKDCNFNTNNYDSVGETTKNSYLISNLENEKNYWIKVKSYGKYNLDFIKNPIINISQEICTSPNDTTPPCVPELQLESFCDLNYNELRWTVSDSCKSDIKEFLIYYSDSQDGDLELLTTVSASERVYTHYPEYTLAACYAISSSDISGNSIPANKLVKICIDNCSYYDLPNVFTPDNDGINDIYKPLPYKFVEKIDFKVFNRWGNLVFETSDPEINWDGTDISTGKKLSNGIYYYICDVYEKRLSGTEVRNITDFIHIYGSSVNKEDR